MCRLVSTPRIAFGAVGLLLTAWTATGIAAEPPIKLHDDNGHYFSWRGEPTILITSAEHYGALLNLDFDFRRYFDALAADGLNHTRVFSGTYREVAGSFGITDNPLAPKPGRYIGPWARSDTPGYFDGGGKFDLTRWDDAYFERLVDLMTAAQQRGVVVELTLFCPLYNDALWRASPMQAANNVNGLGDCPRTEALTLKHPRLVERHVEFTRKVVRTLNRFDNLYFEVCNEPYFGGVTMPWQRRIIDTIVETEARLPNKHLISLNVANGRAKVRQPHGAVSIFNFHYCVPPDTVAMNFGLGKVIGENETGFRGRDDLLYRTEGWDFLLAGGALYNNLDYSFTPGHPDGTLSDYRSPGGGSPALRAQLGILKKFLYGFDFVQMGPDSETVTRVEPKRSVQCLSQRGRQYAVYLHVPLPHKPKDVAKLRRDDLHARVELNLPPGRYNAQWIDTKTGQIVGRRSIESADNSVQLASPQFANDIALRVTAAP